MSIVNYYQVLNITPNAKPQEIEQAFQALMKKHANSERMVNQLLDAFQTLSDPKLRSEYNHKLKTQGIKFNPQPNSFKAKILKLFGIKIKIKQTPVREVPTFVELLDFDWEAIEEPVPDTPQKRKAFWDEVYFKVIILLLVLILITLIFWALRK